jgi:hypothetical protein
MSLQELIRIAVRRYVADRDNGLARELGAAAQALRNNWATDVGIEDKLILRQKKAISANVSSCFQRTTAIYRLSCLPKW